MTEPRQIAVARDYAQLHAALRARADELGLSRDTIDRYGLPRGYASTLLAPVPVKAIGRMSLGPLLGALGLMLIVVEDAELLAQFAAAEKRRNEAHTHGGYSRGRWRRNKAWARVMAARRMLVISPERRREIARKAIRARWARHRREKRKRKEK
jgi:hypothetical protein